MQGILASIHPFYQVEIKKGGSKNDKNKFWSPPTVEDYAKEKKGQVFILPVSYFICQQKNRQEIQNENDAAENHEGC